MAVATAIPRRDWGAAVLLGAALALLYALTAPRTVVLEDDGLFLLAAHANGIAHPPGYPLYTLLAHAATLVPAGSAAWRVHALSGVLAALACVALWLCGRRLGLAQVPALLAAAALGVSPVFWSQAIVAEVYALNALLVFLLLALALQWRAAAAAGSAPRWSSVAAGVLFGLGLSNHWPLLLLMTPGLLVVLAPVTGQVVRALPRLAAGVAVGLLPYAWMVVRSQQVPDIAYHGPIESLQDFWRIVSRADYGAIDRSVTAGLRDKAGLAGFVLAELGRQFGPLGAVLLAAGLSLRLRAGWRVREPLEGGLLLAFLGPTLVLVLLLDFDDDAVHRAMFRVYPAAAYGIAALWLATGAAALVRLGAERQPALRRVLPALVVALTVGVTGLSALRANARAGDDWARRYGEALLAAVPAGGMLVADGESVAGPAGYLHRVEGLRPDVRLVTSTGILFEPRLYRADRLDEAERVAQVRAAMAAEKRPVAYVWPFPHGFASVDLGILRQLDRGASAGSRSGVSEPVVRYADWLLAQPAPRDPAARVHRAELFEQLARWLALLDPSPQSALAAWRDQALQRTRATLHGCLGEAEARLVRGEPPAAARPLLEAAQARIGEATTRRDAAMLALLRGEASLREGDATAAAAEFRRAHEAWPHPANPARQRLGEAATP